MRVRVECYAGWMNGFFVFGSMSKSVLSRKISNSGMGPRAPSSRFARMTASSTSCGMTPRLLMGRGVLLRLGIQGRAELSPAFWGDRISTFCHLPLGEIEMAAVMRRPLSHSDFYSHMLYGLFVF